MGPNYIIPNNAPKYMYNMLLSNEKSIVTSSSRSSLSGFLIG